VQQVCDLLESHIDPFDLDVFTPPLNSNLNRLSQRTSVLLGLLSGPEKQFTSRGNSVTSQEPYNILPLASSQIRFGLLPLSMSQSRKARAATRSVDVTRPLVTPASAPPTEGSFHPGRSVQTADQSGRRLCHTLSLQTGLAFWHDQVNPFYGAF
ncbi:hypothetical protein SKAU_G00297250, partial [Synaphobranchus kaupii]